MKYLAFCFAGIAALFALASTASAATQYEIEVSHDDELFIINGEKFEAQTYCFGMEEGDPVIFLEGSEYGACATAKLLDLRTRDIVKFGASSEAQLFVQADVLTHAA